MWDYNVHYLPECETCAYGGKRHGLHCLKSSNKSFHPPTINNKHKMALESHILYNFDVFIKPSTSLQLINKTYFYNKYGIILHCIFIQAIKKQLSMNSSNYLSDFF